MNYEHRGIFIVNQSLSQLHNHFYREIFLKNPHKNEYCSYCSAFSQNKSIEKSKYIFFTISIRNSKFNIEENKQLIKKKTTTKKKMKYKTRTVLQQY